METTLDFSNIHTLNDFYEIIKKELNFPEYFGNNLDALADCITDGDLPLSIQFIDMKVEQLEQFADVIETLESLSTEIDGLDFSYFLKSYEFPNDEKRALLVVDVQNDFCKDGSLEVPKANEIIPHINELITSDAFDYIIFSQDWHPENHLSFAKNHNKKVGELIDLEGIEQILWPAHCVQDTFGAAFHPDLNTEHTDFIVRKGTLTTVDSYSAFQDNNKIHQTKLLEFLKENQIEVLDVVGLALDYCVKYTCLDAIHFGFSVNLHLEGTRAVNINETDGEKAIEELKKAGVKIIK